MTLKGCVIGILGFAFFWSVSAQPSQNYAEPRWVDELPSINPFEYKGFYLPEDGTIEKACIDFAYEHFPELQNEGVSLEVSSYTTSPLGVHITFRQFYHGYELVPSEVKFNLRKGRIISSLFASIQTVSESGEFDFESDLTKAEAQKVLALYNGTRHPAIRYTEEVGDILYQVIELMNGVRLFNSLESHLRDPVDTLVHTYVYLPDPLTAARVEYGGAYRNFHDSDRFQLTEARAKVKIPMRYSEAEDSFWVENDYVKMIPYDPDGKVPFSFTDTFDFTRAKNGFEFVNALYHITVYKDYLHSLGFPRDELLNYQLKVYPRWRFFHDDTDNSQFIRDANAQNKKEGKGKLRFGVYHIENKEHVDDAEDADVIIHELGHALSFNLNKNIYREGSQRDAIDEGISDYLACSYSRSISEYHWQDLFNWDGAFWGGRSCITSLTLPDIDDISNKYQRGELLAGMCMELWSIVGKEVADRIVVGSMYDYSEGMSIQEAGLLLLDADEALYDGEYSATIHNLLLKYKFLSHRSNPQISLEHLIEINYNLFYQTGSLTISSVLNQNLQVSVCGLDGKLLYSGSFNEQLNVRELTPTSGIYLLKVWTNDIIYVEKLVRQ